MANPYEPDWAGMYSDLMTYQEEDRQQYEKDLAKARARSAASGASEGSAQWNRSVAAVEQSYVDAQASLKRGPRYTILKQRYRQQTDKLFWDKAGEMGYVNEQYESEYDPGSLRPQANEETYYDPARRWLSDQADAGDPVAAQFVEQNTFDAYNARTYNLAGDVTDRVESVGQRSPEELAAQRAQQAAGGRTKLSRGAAPTVASGGWLSDEDEQGWLGGIT